MRKAERERGWGVIAVARWHGLPCRFTLSFNSPSINTQRMQRPSTLMRSLCAGFFWGRALWVSPVYQPSHATAREQQTWTASAKTFTTQRPSKFRLWIWSAEMMSVRFLMPPGWLSGPLFIHVSLLYRNYVQKPHIFVCNQKVVPYIWTPHMKDETIRGKTEIKEIKALETVAVCGLADWGQVSSIFLSTFGPDV